MLLRPSGDDGIEAALRLQGSFAADIRICGRIEAETPRMANGMFFSLTMRCRGTHKRSPLGWPGRERFSRKEVFQ